MTLWFSATAVLPELTAAWNLTPGQAAGMTAAVQLGFVLGALAAAASNLADVVAPRRLFGASAVFGALANAALLLEPTPAVALALRFATGVALAGVYPPGMKIAAGHAPPERRGFAIGLLVAALTLGSATPHLVAGLSLSLPWTSVLLVASGLAVLAAVLVSTVVPDGPHQAAPAPFDPGSLGRVLRDRDLQLANLGYFGHMWELYGWWTWLVVWLGGAYASTDARRVAFAAIGLAGAAGAIVAGLAADRLGRTTTTIAALVVSGACCLISPWLLESPLLLPFLGIWGFAIIADSAQFSTAVTELAEPAYVGTALTLQTSLGFALTLIPIWGLPLLADAVGWRWAFLALVPGPVVGAAAMAWLRSRPASSRLAGGRR